MRAVFRLTKIGSGTYKWRSKKSSLSVYWFLLYTVGERLALEDATGWAKTFLSAASFGFNQPTLLCLELELVPYGAHDGLVMTRWHSEEKARED